MNLDLPFKLALQNHGLARAVASWVTGEKIVAVKHLKTNYVRPIAEMQADNVFHITADDGTVSHFHLEIQSAASHRDMALRMFDYSSRILCQSNDLKTRLYSVVLYVGEGAGKHDNGIWEFGTPPLGVFHYHVIKLWQIEASELLKQDNAALLALLPQSKMRAPEAELQAAMEKIYQLEDKEQVANLLFILKTLNPEKGLRQMVDLFINEKEILDSTPFLREVYLEWHGKGRKEGREEGLEKGLEEGMLQGQMHTILELLNLKFDLDTDEQQSITSVLRRMNKQQLDRTLKHVVQAAKVADFKAWLSQQSDPPAPTA